MTASILTRFTQPVPGVTLHGARRGSTATDALPLVFLHGFGGEHADWGRVWAHLPPGLPLIAYDRRGYGASQPDDADAEYRHADDLAALLDALGLPRAHIVGMSEGGAVATSFALDHPDRVGKLMLVSPLLAGWEWSADWSTRWKAIGRAARSGDMATARELWWHHPLFDSARDDPEQAAEVHAGIARFSGRQWIRDPQALALPDLDRLASLAVPTLLLTGGRDQPDFQLMADSFAALIPDLRRIDDPGAGHMLHVERAPAVAAAISEFIGG
jgi:2-succinyl-6-hydroxy-2,4-cyclohexadiene-1-carboxylate synthase